VRFTDGWQALLNALVPLVSVAVGYFAATAGEARRDERALDREREQRAAERAAAAQDRADAFELQVLRDLFAALHDRFRLQSGHYVEYRRLTKDKPDALPLQVAHEASDGEAARLLQAEMTRLAWLILDDDLRIQVERTSDLLNGYWFAEGRAEAERAQMEGSTVAVETLRAIAARIRAIHAADRARVSEPLA
jgi:hypothetical protein